MPQQTQEQKESLMLEQLKYLGEMALQKAAVVNFGEKGRDKLNA